MYLLAISEDIFALISGLGLSQGILLAILIWFHPKADHKVSRLLALYIACLSVIMSGPLLLKLIGWMDSAFVAPFPALCGPLLYFYIRSFREKVTWQKAWPHFILFVVYFVAVYAWISDLGHRHPDSKDFPQEAFRSPIGLVFFNVRYIHLAIYYFLSRRELRSYRRSINQLFSETSRIDLGWAKWLINGYAFIIIASVVIFFLMSQYPENYYLLYLINIAIATPYIYMATYKGITQPTIWQKDQRDENHNLARQMHDIQKPGIAPDIHRGKAVISADNKTGEIIAGVLSLMDNEKIFQEPELTLQHIADRLGYPSYLVSLSINEGMRKSFYDLVNGYRVEEAKRLLLDGKSRNYTILSVGFEAGFNSKTTFNTVFKKFTGMTPTEFRDRQNPPVTTD